MPIFGAGESLMAKKKEEVHYSQLGTEELSRKLNETQQNLFKLRFRAVSAPLKNPMEISKLRKEVARIQTFMNQKRPATAAKETK
jgi:large subunit ribosomal protein L29